jgi:uridine phosphorylase
MQHIAESELIINERGGIYHLDTTPDELGDTIITVGDPDRVADVSKHFDSVEVKNKHREFVLHTGFIGKKRISCVATGIGPDNIDIVFNELDALLNIDFEKREIKPSLKSVQIIRIGTSGSLQADIPVDSFVASTHGIGIDNLMNFYRTEHNEEEKQILHSFITHTQLHQQITSPYITAASMQLQKHFVHGYHHGITVTCPGFYGPQGRILRLGLANPELINHLTTFQFGNHRISNFEMETAAIYGLGKALGHHCISLNAMVANRVTKQFSKDGKKLVEQLIKKSVEIIASI